MRIREAWKQIKNDVKYVMWGIGITGWIQAARDGARIGRESAHQARDQCTCGDSPSIASVATCKRHKAQYG